MKKCKRLFLALSILFPSLISTGCWNYKEIEQMQIVTGVAFDEGKNEKLKLTAETVNIQGGKDVKVLPELISSEGKTVFDAARNAIAITGQKLYWSHSKVLIISQKLAAGGIIKIIDWYNRDAETRPDVHILISGEKTAREILNAKLIDDKPISFELEDILDSQSSLSKAPQIDILHFDNALIGEGISAIAPVVSLRQMAGRTVPQVMGTAVFNMDKLVGILNGEDTKYLLFARNLIEGGILVENLQTNGTNTQVSLEIFDNKTRVRPIISGGNPMIHIDVRTITAIDEMDESTNLIDESGRKRLELQASKSLKHNIEELIRKVQDEYGVDVFGFGAKLRQSNIKAWNKLRGNWREEFTRLPVKVSVEVKIRNSAMMSKPLKVSD